jgi:AbrB family looped-hinge helix DNA binding protein
MSRVTSKLQVTIPKAVAAQYRIRPGTEVVFEPAGEAIRLRVADRRQDTPKDEIEWRLGLLRESEARQEKRNQAYRRLDLAQPRGRGWTREELYGRGVSR